MTDLPRRVRWIELQKFWDERGALTPVEGGRNIPFELKRIFYFYDVPAGEARGSHAHRQCQQVLVCISGSFDVVVDDGRASGMVTCDRPWRGLYVPPMVWASQVNFAGGTVGLVLASHFFDEADYIRDFDEFRRAVGSG